MIFARAGLELIIPLLLLAAILLYGNPASAQSPQLISADIAVNSGEIRALGGSNARLASILEQAKLMPPTSGYTAVLGVFAPIQMDNSLKIIVGSGPADKIDTNTVHLFANTLLVIPAEIAEHDTGLISSVRGATEPRGQVLFDDTARLYLSNARIGKTYTPFHDDMKIRDFNGTRLDLEKFVLTDSPLLMPVPNNSISRYAITFRPGFVDEIYPRTSPAQQVYLTEALEKDLIGPAHVNDSAGGVRLLSRAIDRRYLGSDPDAVARTLQSAQDMLQAGAVANMAWQTQQTMLDTMTLRTSFRSVPVPPSLPSPAPTENGESTPHPESNGLAAGDSVSPGNVALWVQPLYGRWNSSGVASLNRHFTHETDASLGGFAVGADYTIANLLRAGVSLGLGSGHSEGGGDYSCTENDMTFRSLGAYLALKWDDWLVAGSVNHTWASHDISQELDSRLNMANLSASVDTRSYGYRLHQEWRKRFDWFTAIEYMSVGETWLAIDSYTTKSGHRDVIRGAGLEQQIGTFTAGVAIERQFDLDALLGANWWIKPVLDYGITQAYGDIENMSRISLTGLEQMDQKAYTLVTTTDAVTYRLRASLFAGNDSMQFGVTWSHDESAHARGDSVQASFVWKF